MRIPISNKTKVQSVTILNYKHTSHDAAKYANVSLEFPIDDAGTAKRNHAIITGYAAQ